MNMKLMMSLVSRPFICLFTNLCTHTGLKDGVYWFVDEHNTKEYGKALTINETCFLYFYVLRVVEGAPC